MGQSRYPGIEAPTLEAMVATADSWDRYIPVIQTVVESEAAFQKCELRYQTLEETLADFQKVQAELVVTEALGIAG